VTVDPAEVDPMTFDLDDPGAAAAIAEAQGIMREGTDQLREGAGPQPSAYRADHIG
jgi:hypothetical protein